MLWQKPHQFTASSTVEPAKNVKRRIELSEPAIRARKGYLFQQA
jgi:hypothetical protein